MIEQLIRTSPLSNMEEMARNNGDNSLGKMFAEARGIRAPTWCKVHKDSMFLSFFLFFVYRCSSAIMSWYSADILFWIIGAPYVQGVILTSIFFLDSAGT